VGVDISSNPAALSESLANSTANASLSFKKSNGVGHKDSYSYSSLRGKNIKLKVKGDVPLSGAQMHGTGDIEGEVQGNVLVDTLQDKHIKREASLDGRLGVSGGLLGGGITPNLGGGFSVGGENSVWDKQQSGLTSGGKFDVVVGGKTYNYGGKIGSESGQTHLETEEYVWKDLDSHAESKGQGLHASLQLGEHQIEKGEHIRGGVDFHYHLERKQTRAALGQGEVIQHSKTASSLVGLNRDLAKTYIELYKTGIVFR
jgi:hypothetical protein